MNRFLTCLLILSGCLGSVSHAQIYQYSNDDTSNARIALGYEVPVPVESMTPVDGFRTYQSLDLRHQQLVAESALFERLEIGTTIEGRSIWLYQLGDANDNREHGGKEGVALINGGIHAREWQSPEAVTGYMETLFDNRQDQHLGEYLLNNLDLWIIPVLNIDGYLQTQRFPDRVTDSRQSPRDGRMRRKNMRDVDYDLATRSDNLNGIDLNRNNDPYWATNSERSSDDVQSIVHHGAGPASEPETQALIAAAQLAGTQRLRFYTDTHSFSQVYFAPMTGNNRRDNMTTRLATIMRSANGYKYQYGPGDAGAGIGATDEYFAVTYQVPSYTLELEPLQGAREYGGNGVSHDGFILPNSEVARMRLETANATLAGLYAVTEPPVLIGLQVFDESGTELIVELAWQAQGMTRALTLLQEGELQAQTNYQFRLRFNKPMRLMADGQVVGFGDRSEALDIQIVLAGESGGQAVSWDIDSSNGSWMVEDDFAQYKTDTFAVPVSLASDFDWSSLSKLALEVTTVDFSGLALDANPATVTGWQNGAWSAYEDELGSTNTDTGGVDRAMRLIDDGSDLFPPTQPVPSPQPNPQPDSGGGGGSLSGLWLLLLAIAGRRNLWR